MNLEEYLKEKDWSVTKFARKAKCSAPTIAHLIRDGRDCRGSILAKIELATAHQVTMMDLYRDYVKEK